MTEEEIRKALQKRKIKSDGKDITRQLSPLFSFLFKLSGKVNPHAVRIVFLDFMEMDDKVILNFNKVVGNRELPDSFQSIQFNKNNRRADVLVYLLSLNRRNYKTRIQDVADGVDRALPTKTLKNYIHKINFEIGTKLNYQKYKFFLVDKDYVWVNPKFFSSKKHPQ